MVCTHIWYWYGKVVRQSGQLHIHCRSETTGPIRALDCIFFYVSIVSSNRPCLTKPRSHRSRIDTSADQTTAMVL